MFCKIVSIRSRYQLLLCMKLEIPYKIMYQSILWNLQKTLLGNNKPVANIWYWPILGSGAEEDLCTVIAGHDVSAWTFSVCSARGACGCGERSLDRGSAGWGWCGGSGGCGTSTHGSLGTGVQRGWGCHFVPQTTADEQSQKGFSGPAVVPDDTGGGRMASLLTPNWTSCLQDEINFSEIGILY